VGCAAPPNGECPTSAADRRVADPSAVELYGRSGVYAVSVTRVLDPDDATQAGRALALAELMRIVLDQAHLSWEEA